MQACTQSYVCPAFQYARGEYMVRYVPERQRPGTEPRAEGVFRLFATVGDGELLLSDALHPALFPLLPSVLTPKQPRAGGATVPRGLPRSYGGLLANRKGDERRCSQNP